MENIYSCECGDSKLNCVGRGGGGYGPGGRRCPGGGLHGRGGGGYGPGGRRCPGGGLHGHYGGHGGCDGYHRRHGGRGLV